MDVQSGRPGSPAHVPLVPWGFRVLGFGFWVSGLGFRV